MITKEGEIDDGVDMNDVISVSTEHVRDSSSNVSDKRTSSDAAAAAGGGGSVSINQMVRDFIIAKTIGMNNSDRGDDGTKLEKDRKGHHKSSKDKKKKKKKKKHKSHDKESSSKHRSHRHRDHKPDASSESSSSDEGRAIDIIEETSVVNSDYSKVKDGSLTPLKEKEDNSKILPVSQESVNFTETKKTLLHSGACSKCSCARQIKSSGEQTTKTDEAPCCCVGPAEVDDKMMRKNETVLSQHKDETDNSSKGYGDTSDCIHFTSTVSEPSQVEIRMSSDSQHSGETICHLQKLSTVSHKPLEEARKYSKKQDNKREASSKSRHCTESSEMSDCSRKQHSSRDHRYSRDHIRDKPANARKNSPMLENVSKKHSSVTEDSKSDDVVFVKKVPAYDALKTNSSRETVSDRQKLNRQQKLRSIVVSDSRKWGSKHRYDSESSEENDTVPQCKVKRSGRQTRDSPIILLSDDDVDVLSDEMVEKLHKRLTTSIKKSKELQAERELKMVADLKTNESFTSHSTVLMTEPVCDDASSTTALSHIKLPADPSVTIPTSHDPSASASEQSAVKSAASTLFCGKKPVKFGLKISESSAAWISKGIKSSQTNGNK